MSDGDAFRSQATRVFRLACVLLAAGPPVAAAVGWRAGGWLGLAVGGGLATALAVAALPVVCMMWAMSQDGA